MTVEQAVSIVTLSKAYYGVERTIERWKCAGSEQRRLCSRPEYTHCSEKAVVSESAESNEFKGRRKVDEHCDSRSPDVPSWRQRRLPLAQGHLGRREAARFWRSDVGVLHRSAKITKLEQGSSVGSFGDKAVFDLDVCSRRECVGGEFVEAYMKLDDPMEYAPRWTMPAAWQTWAAFNRSVANCMRSSALLLRCFSKNGMTSCHQPHRDQISWMPSNPKM